MRKDKNYNKKMEKVYIESLYSTQTHTESNKVIMCIVFCNKTKCVY